MQFAAAQALAASAWVLRPAKGAGLQDDKRRLDQRFGLIGQNPTRDDSLLQPSFAMN
jgi:hypothetical protein